MQYINYQIASSDVRNYPMEGKSSWNWIALMFHSKILCTIIFWQKWAKFTDSFLIKRASKTKGEKEIAPDTRSSGENQNRGIFLGRLNLFNVETSTHSLAQFHHISSFKPAQQLCRRSSHALHQKVKRTFWSCVGRRRGDGQERWLLHVRDS